MLAGSLANYGRRRKVMSPPDAAAKPRSKILDRALSLVAAFNVVAIIIVARYCLIVPRFSTDAYAAVAVAYHRAVGAYTRDSEMQQLGTAAVHLLTVATSYMKTQELSPKI